MATLTDVDAETMRQRLVVKESLTQAFNELRAAEASGAELPDARKLFKYECKGTYIGGYPQMADDYDNITYPLTELGWELGEEINPVMYTAQEWEKYRNTPFVRNVEKEGVRI